MIIETWLLPVALMVAATVIAFPLSKYLAWIMDGKYRPLPVLGWFEKRLDSGPQDWKQYTASLLIFNTLLFVFGFLILSLQPWMPLNPDGKGMLSPTTIFHSVISFMTNTNLQHYSGDQHLSNFSQIFFCISNMFVSAAVGFCALVRHDSRFSRRIQTSETIFVDMWRVLVYMFVPAAFILGLIFIDARQPHDPSKLSSCLDARTSGHGNY